ncbi:MAG: hypothetical protein EHJ95_08615 [Methanobacteriota archaeon]|nr:MAG: hypothetical protein EHJ95_08615 [Euryarchaeota archaeon]
MRVIAAPGLGSLLGSSPCSADWHGCTKQVLAVGAAQRLLSAALAVATINFTNPDVKVMILVVSLVALVIRMFAGGELVKRAEASSAAIRAEKTFLKVRKGLCRTKG